jgi:hypothetical protein
LDCFVFAASGLTGRDVSQSDQSEINTVAELARFSHYWGRSSFVSDYSVFFRTGWQQRGCQMRLDRFTRAAHGCAFTCLVFLFLIVAACDDDGGQENDDDNDDALPDDDDDTFADDDTVTDDDDTSPDDDSADDDNDSGDDDDDNDDDDNDDDDDNNDDDNNDDDDDNNPFVYQNGELQIELLAGGYTHHEGAGLVVEPDGTAHIAALRGHWLAVYTISPAGDVSVEAVQPYAMAPSLTRDGQGTLHLVFYDFAVWSLKHAVRTDKGWNSEVIDFATGALYKSSVLTDGDGFVHVVTYGRDEAIRYFHNRLGDWTMSTLPEPDVKGMTSKFLLGEDGAVDVAFSTFDHMNWVGYAKWAHHIDGGWTTETIWIFGGEVTIPAFARDPGGTLHAVYGQAGGLVERYYATKQAGGWDSVMLPALSTETSPDLVFDPAGNPHVLMVTTRHLTHLTTSGDQWTREFVAGPTDFNAAPFVLADAGGGLHAAFLKPGGLALARAAAKAWEIVDVDLAGRADDGVPAARAANGTLYALYTNLDRGLMLVTRQGGATGIEAVDDQSYYYPNFNLAAGNQDVQVAFADVEYRLYWATRDGGSWQASLLAPAGDTEIGMTIDADGATHLLYLEPVPDSFLQYATNASGDWEFDSVLADATGGVRDLAVDTGGTAHICFVTCNPFTVYYANNAGGEWNTEPLLVEDGKLCRVVVDGNDAVHLLYAGKWELHYRTNAGGDWTDELVSDEFVSVYGDIRLLLDSAGEPHAVKTLYTEEDPSVRYYHRDPTWSEVTIEANGELDLLSQAGFVQTAPDRLGVVYGAADAVWLATFPPGYEP